MTSTLLFAAGIVGFVVLLVFILSYITIRQRRKETEKQEQYFLKTAAVFNVIIYKKDMLQHRMIGWDEMKKQLLYVDFSNQPYEPKLIKTADIASSRLLVNNHSITEKIKGEDKVTESFVSSVKLRLHYKNSGQGFEDLGFYKYGIDTFHNLSHLKAVAGEWEELINANSGNGKQV